MPIISKIGRKRPAAMGLLAVIYLLLTVGGVTMLYPFLLMVATSLTGQTDYQEFKLVPRYFHDPESRCVKFLAEKYQRSNDYSDLHAHTYLALRNLAMPTFRDDPDPPKSGPRTDSQSGRELSPRVVIDTDLPHIERRVELWRQFQQDLEPIKFALWHVGWGNMPGKAEMLWRTHLRKTFDGDVEAMNHALGKDLVAFTEAFAPYEKPSGRLWPGVQGEQGRLWAEFKGTLDARYRRPVDGTVLWQRFLRFKYERTEDFNRACGTKVTDFKHVALPRRKPDNPALAKQWEILVREELPYRFVLIDGGDALYRKFLADNHGPIDVINRRMGTSYASAEDIHWPPAGNTMAELDAVSAFLRTAGDAASFRIDTPDLRYGDSLRQQFGNDLSRLNAELDGQYASFDDVRPPYEEEDLWEFRQDSGTWLKWFLTRNYAEVVDYIAVRGRAFWNTLILVASMIFCALTINPLAAYALSRFRLGYTNQVLLFLLATMAFPYEVAMIPNFLLLRRFPLWTWLVGGVVGLVVAAIILRKTTGRRKLLAVPAGLGSAAVAGFYLTPLLGRLFGIEIAPVSLLNTFAALILPRMANGYGIFLLKGFFDSLPEEIFEAGRIDGASEMRMLWQVAFPLSKPIFAVMALQTFTAIYGSYIWALVVCQSDRMWTLMVYIFQLQQWAPSHVTMAATVLASLPTLLVFVFAQKIIMRGIIIPTYK
ncbi:MAG: carbohydrate ABC transporter permease [Planctomycetota bacterium]|jgi:multiple sugar transport system permease protein